MIELPRLLAVLRRTRFIIGAEKDLQSQIADVLKNEGIDFEREYSLGPRDRVDFFCPPGIAIEVKIGGSKLAIFRQLKRYAEADAVKEIVLVSAVSMGLPWTINGKQARIVSLGEQWL